MEDKVGEKMPETQTYRPNLQIDVDLVCQFSEYHHVFEISKWVLFLEHPVYLDSGNISPTCVYWI